MSLSGYIHHRKRHPCPTRRSSDLPLQKSWQKTKPTLGWPRVTDSLCPKCVKEARQRIIEGGEDPWKIIQEKPGERSEEHTSELQSLRHLVCRLLLEKKNMRGMGHV